MKKYINSFSLHLYAIVFLLMLLLASVHISFTGLLIFLCLFIPLMASYIRRVKDMSEDDIIEKLGFKGNKFFDPNME